MALSCGTILVEHRPFPQPRPINSRNVRTPGFLLHRTGDRFHARVAASAISLLKLGRVFRHYDSG
jgi:hypothetical protein